MFTGASRIRLLLAACGVAALASAAAFACGGDGDNGSGNGDRTSTSTSDASPGGSSTASATAAPPTATPSGQDLIEPQLVTPVSQYSILVQDLGIQNFRTDLSVTATLTADDYATSSTFAGEEEGRRQLDEWGYVDGYKTGLIPEGGGDAMLTGGYVVYHELHLYETTAGAHDAFEYLAENVSENAGAEVITIATVANESIASRGISGKVGTSNIDQVLHQIIFRRGNAVAIVLTIGAEPLMDIVTAVELSGFIDGKMLDEREHPVPTPTPERSPSPEATATPTP